MFKEITFKCIRCGNCCRWAGYVNITNNEIDSIAQYLNIPSSEFIEKYTHLRKDRTGLSLKEKNDDSCIFYNKKNSECIINNVKPGQCRAFPVKWNFKNWQKYCGAYTQQNK